MISRFWKKPRIDGRRIRLERLEERIVLDASVVNTDAENNSDDNPGEASQGSQGKDVCTEQTGLDPAASSSESSDPVGEIFRQDLNVVLISNALDDMKSISNSGENELEVDARVLVISSMLDGADHLASAAQDDVLTLVYDGANDTLDTILFTIEEALEGREAGRIAFATHDLGEGRFHLTSCYSVSPSTLLGSTELQRFWEGVGDFLSNDGRIDILACDLARSDSGSVLLSQLEALTGHDVAASDDPTGNPDYGGDWTLETDGVDLVSTYFLRGALDDFEGTLEAEEKVVASDGAEDDRFGSSVSVSGDYAIVGADLDDDNGVNSGSAYIYQRTAPNTWGNEFRLTATDGSEYDYFGCSVSISGDYAIIGAIGADGSTSGSGCAYVYQRTGDNTWGNEFKLTAPAGWRPQDRFGCSVSISDDYAIVGADLDDDRGENSGSANVYRRTGPNTWGDRFKLRASDGEEYDWFGRSVSISGDYAIVGAPGDDDKGSASGSVYLYQRTGQRTWGNETKLTASDGGGLDQFGYSVSISGDYAIAGAFGDDDNGDRTGSAYVYQRTGGNTWSNEAKLTASDGAYYDHFGWSVSISSGYAIVGAYSDDDNGSGSGSAYVYRRVVGNAWGSETKLTASDAASGDSFGRSVSIWGDYAIIGAPFDDDNGSSSGSAYIFRYAGPDLDLDADDSSGVAGKDYATHFTKAGGAVDIADDDVSIADLDDANIQSATVTLTNRPDGTAETLSLSGPLPGGLGTTGYDADTGRLVITGMGALAEYEAAIALVQYYNDSDNPDLANRTITVVVNDGSPNGDSNVAVCTASLNYGPAAGYFKEIGVQEIASPIDGWNFTDTEGHEAAHVGVTGLPENGTLFLDADGDDQVDAGEAIIVLDEEEPATWISWADATANQNVKFSPDAGWTGSTTLTYRVRDLPGQWGTLNVATVIVTPPGKIISSDGADDDYFGSCVAVSGDYAIIGAPMDDDEGFCSGSAYVYQRSGDNAWGNEFKLIASDGASLDCFGCSVSISGDYAIVGAYGNGAAYIYQRIGENTWGNELKLIGSNGLPGDRFGYSVSISGDCAIVGASTDDHNGARGGSAYIFERNYGGADNWGQRAKLIASDGADWDYFGYSVSLGGDYAVVGSYWDDDNGENSGSAYIFERNCGGANNWGQRAKLTASDGAEDDEFGCSVSIFGDYAVVGARKDDDGGSDAGSAYIYQRTSENTWENELKLMASDGAQSDRFGGSVSINGDVVIVGSEQDDDNDSDSGSAYAYRRVAGNIWGHEAKLTASDGAARDHFGRSVSTSGDVAVVGACWDDDNGNASGSAYVHDVMSDYPALDLAASAPGTGHSTIFAEMGGAVAIAPNDVSIIDADDSHIESATVTLTNRPDGAAETLVLADTLPGGLSTTGYDAGTGRLIISGTGTLAEYEAATELVLYNNTSETPHTPNRTITVAVNDGDHDSNTAVSTVTVRTSRKIVASDGAAHDDFGEAVSISGDYTIIGAPTDDDKGTSSGSAYVYHRTGDDIWGDEFKLTASDGAAGDRFGHSVSISGEYAIVGAYGDNDNGHSSGSVYFYRQIGDSSWGNEFKLTASDGAVQDFFGYSVSICGDYAIVGAYWDDDNGQDSGSVYIYQRTGDNTWGNEFKLTASDGAAYQYFGYSVAISGDSAIVGAVQDKERGFRSGAVYVYERTGDNTWGNEFKLTAWDGMSYDHYGNSVSISGDHAIVGAYWDDDRGSCSGSAYVYERTEGNTWGNEFKLTAFDGAASDQFGHSVSISGNIAIVGANWDDDDGSRSGSAYLYQRTGDNTWARNDKLTAFDGATSDELGHSVSISGNTAVVGAHVDDDQGDDSGSAYVFDRISGSPAIDLDASSPGTGFLSSFTEDGGPVNIAGDDVSIIDIDDTHVDSATVLLYNCPDGVAESLSLSGGLPGGLSSTGYDSNTGELVIHGSGSLADYEAAIELIVYDNTSDDPDTADRIITVTVNDGDYDSDIAFSIVSIAARNDVPTDVSLDNSSVEENQPVGTVVGGFSTADQDSADIHTYALVSGPGDTDNASFSIDGSSLKTSAAFDFETENSYSIRVQTDDGNGGVFQEIFTVTVTDENDAPTGISLDTSMVPENQPVGTVVGGFSTADQDGTDGHTYALVSGPGDTDNISFWIDGANLKTSAVFDYEIRNAYSIRIRTDDGNGGTYEDQFTIGVSDLDETPINSGSIICGTLPWQDDRDVTLDYHGTMEAFISTTFRVNIGEEELWLSGLHQIDGLASAWGTESSSPARASDAESPLKRTSEHVALSGFAGQGEPTIPMDISKPKKAQAHGLLKTWWDELSSEEELWDRLCKIREIKEPELPFYVDIRTLIDRLSLEDPHEGVGNAGELKEKSRSLLIDMENIRVADLFVSGPPSGKVEDTAGAWGSGQGFSDRTVTCFELDKVRFPVNLTSERRA